MGKSSHIVQHKTQFLSCVNLFLIKNNYINYIYQQLYKNKLPQKVQWFPCLRPVTCCSGETVLCSVKDIRRGVELLRLVAPSSRAAVVVSDELLHPLDLAFVLGHVFVEHAVLQEMLLAVVNLSAVLQLEGAQGFQGPQQDLWRVVQIQLLCILH